MNTKTINVKIDSKTKQEAQQVAEELGFTLSSLIKAYLKEISRTKEVRFSLEKELVPTPYLEKALEESQKDVEGGYVSPAFDNADEADAWLKDPNAKFVNGRSVRDDD